MLFANSLSVFNNESDSIKKDDAAFFKRHRLFMYCYEIIYYLCKHTQKDYKK